MSDELSFPDYAWKEGQVRPAIEVSIDFLPRAYAGNWHRAMFAMTDRWCRANRFPKLATIWMWGTESSNLISRHPDNPEPTWSDFLIEFGFPKKFWTELGAHLQHEFHDQCSITEMLPSTRAEGWVPICHVEQEKVWRDAGGESWEPYTPPSAASRLRRR